MVSGRTSTRGSASSMKWTAAKLLDTVRRRGDDGEHGYDGGAAMVASAMAGACEGEELERRGGVWEVQRREGDRSMASPGEGSGEAAGSCMAHMLCSRSSSCLPAWPSQAARWSGGWAGPAGGPGAGRQVRFFYFFLFSVF